MRKWRGEIRRQKLEIDRDIRSLTVEQKKVERSIKEAVGRNDMASAKVGILMRFGVCYIYVHDILVCRSWQKSWFGRERLWLGWQRIKLPWMP